MATKKTGSDLLKSLGKNKKAQMKVLYPGMSTASKSKNIGKKISKSKNVSSSSGKEARKEVIRVMKRTPKDLKKGLGFKSGALLGAGSTYLVGKSNINKKSAKAKAKDAADKLLKKQKDKKKHHSK